MTGGNERPLVSIVTPTYNRADFIGEAVQSVLAQSYGCFEQLIIDDGSTDNTADILAPFLEDERLRYFRQENQGQSVARNRGISEARGDFICFLDSDNRWLPDKLEKSLEAFAADPDAAIVYGDIVTISETGEELSRDNMKRFSGRITGRLLGDNFISMNTTMVRRECFDTLGGFNEQDRLAEDYELWLRFSTRYTFRYVPAYMAFYRVMENQISTDKEARFQANEQIVHNFVRQYGEMIKIRERRAGLSRFYLRKARYQSSQDQFKGACSDLLRAFRLHPYWAGPWRTLGRLIMDRF